MKRSMLGLGLTLSAITMLYAADLAPLGIRQDVEAWHVGSVAAGRGPAAAFWNPALLGYEQGTTQLEFIFSGEDEDHPQTDELGVFANLGGLGFGMIHEESPAGLFVNQYRLGLGSGTRGNYTGLAYGWSVGNDDSAKTPDQLILSCLTQPHRYVSFGSTATWALGNTYQQPGTLLESGLALRPFTDRVTLSVDGAWRFDGGSYIERSAEYWAGVEVEPVDYLRLSARKHLDTDDIVFQAGLNLRHLSLGAILPDAESDAKPGPGTRYSVLFSDRTFNKGLALRHKKQLFARIELAGMAGEYPWLMVGQKFQLQKFLTQMEAAEKNPRLKGLFLNIRPDFQADMALLREIRERIVEYKAKTGGEVAVYCHGHSLGTLYLASVADRRAMLPIGEAQIDNMGRERLYLADAFEEAGIDFVRFNIGAYKGAGEDFDRNAMSPEVRENVGACLNDIYNHVTEGIREGYGLSQAQLDELLAHWFVTRDQLMAMKLVDTLLYDDQVEDWVCRRESSDDDDDKKSVGFTISLGVNMKDLEKLKGDRVVSLASLTELPIHRRWGGKPEIAVIYASGPIYSGRSLGPLAIGDETLIKQFKAVREDDNIKAVVFHIDSPGGSGYASDLVWREMERLKKKKPLIVVQGFVAASGGYYLSMAADTILSTPMTITGSIGVAAGLFFDKGLMNNAKLRQDGVWAGKKESFGGTMVAAPLDFKAGSAQLRMPPLPIFGRELTENQSLELHAMIKDFYTDFVQKVADCRDKSWEEVNGIAEGRVWSGPAAQKLGLVDGQGGLRDGIELARLKADLKKEDVKIKEIHPELSFEDIIQLLQMLRQGGGMSAAQQRLFAEQVGLTQDMRLSILGSGKPELLLDDQPYQGFGW